MQVTGWMGHEIKRGTFISLETTRIKCNKLLSSNVVKNANRLRQIKRGTFISLATTRIKCNKFLSSNVVLDGRLNQQSHKIHVPHNQKPAHIHGRFGSLEWVAGGDRFGSTEWSADQRM